MLWKNVTKEVKKMSKSDKVRECEEKLHKELVKIQASGQQVKAIRKPKK